MQPLVGRVEVMIIVLGAATGALVGSALGAAVVALLS